MATRRRERRIGIAPPQLVGQLRLSGIEGLDNKVATEVERSWDEAVRVLQNFLKYIQEGVDDGLPAGAYEDKPMTIRAGHSGAVGDAGLGWTPGPHDHEVLVIPPVGLGNALAEGSAEELVRGDHVHKRDVRGKLNGVDVATKNALDFRSNTVIGFSVTEDIPNDELDILATLSNEYKTAPAGGTVKNASGISVDDAIVFIAPYACDVINVKGIRRDGTGATVNMRKNFTSEHLASDLSLPAVDTLYDGGAVQNVSYAEGDIMDARVKSVAGTPTHIAIVAYVRRTG